MSGRVIPDPWAKWFTAEPRKGVSLTAEGQHLAALWLTFLRRMLQQREEYHLMRYGFEQEAARKRKQKPFFQLPDYEQITLLRAFWRTKHTQERRLLYIEYRNKYGLTSHDIHGQLRKYGEIIKSAAYLPDPLPGKQ